MGSDLRQICSAARPRKRSGAPDTTACVSPAICSTRVRFGGEGRGAIGGHRPPCRVVFEELDDGKALPQGGLDETAQQPADPWR